MAQGFEMHAISRHKWRRAKWHSSNRIWIRDAYGLTQRIRDTYGLTQRAVHFSRILHCRRSRVESTDFRYTINCRLLCLVDAWRYPTPGPY